MKKTPLRRKTGFKRKGKKATKKKTDKKSSIRLLKQKVWKQVSRAVRARDKNCVTCGAPATQAGHFRHNTDKPTQTLGGNKLWWDERNINGQCSACNLYRSGALDKYALYLEKKYGHGILQELDTLYRTYKSWTEEECLEVYEYYKEMEATSL